MTSSPLTVVVADACVLINLIVTRRLAMLTRLEGYRFVVPDEVVAEVSRPGHPEVLRAAIANGEIERCAVDAVEAAELIQQFHDVIGPGELACLALAAMNGWTVASDERRRFRREAIERLGATRLIGTVDIYLLLIRDDLLTVDDADADKELLHANRFALKFGSFGELMEE